jgi:hypothetical protein
MLQHSICDLAAFTLEKKSLVMWLGVLDMAYKLSGVARRVLTK